MGKSTKDTGNTLFFDDFQIGMVFDAPRILIAESEIIEFAQKYDPQPFHIDPKAAADGYFGSIISSGFMTVAKAFTQFLELGLIKESSMGGWGIDELRWFEPVFPNDVLSTRIKVFGKKLSSKGFDRGTIRFKITVLNQENVKVMQFISNTIIRQKPSGKNLEED